jgi:hypothetical protein
MSIKSINQDISSARHDEARRRRQAIGRKNGQQPSFDVLAVPVLALEEFPAV